MTYTISEFAEKFDTTENEIREYTELEILPFLEDEEEGMLFDDNSAAWMDGILFLLEDGSTLEDIQEYCEVTTPINMKAMIEAKYRR